mmetsp:Transcript_34060/g.57267  ORF Transcript_34060/g.57267 Transcript_34060/m.57267 type:complete len:205 (-) Transcript_34060:586-1200(-)
MSSTRINRKLNQACCQFAVSCIVYRGTSHFNCWPPLKIIRVPSLPKSKLGQLPSPESSQSFCIVWIRETVEVQDRMLKFPVLVYPMCRHNLPRQTLLITPSIHSQRHKIHLITLDEFLHAGSPLCKGNSQHDSHTVCIRSHVPTSQSTSKISHIFIFSFAEWQTSPNHCLAPFPVKHFFLCSTRVCIIAVLVSLKRARMSWQRQ